MLRLVCLNGSPGPVAVDTRIYVYSALLPPPSPHGGVLGGCPGGFPVHVRLDQIAPAIVALSIVASLRAIVASLASLLFLITVVDFFCGNLILLSANSDALLSWTALSTSAEDRWSLEHRAGALEKTSIYIYICIGDFQRGV